MTRRTSTTPILTLFLSLIQEFFECQNGSSLYKFTHCFSHDTYVLMTPLFSDQEETHFNLNLVTVSRSRNLVRELPTQSTTPSFPERSS